MNVCLSVCLYLSIDLSIYLCIYVSMYVCMYVWMDVWMYGCMYVSICLSIYVALYLCIYVSISATGWRAEQRNLVESGFSICYFIQRYTLLVQHLLFHPEIHTAVSRAYHFTQRFPMEGDCVGVHTWTGRGLGQLRGGTGAGERKRGRDTWVDTAVRQQLFREFFMHLPCHSETCRPSLQKVGAHIFSLFPNWRNRSDR